MLCSLMGLHAALQQASHSSCISVQCGVLIVYPFLPTLGPLCSCWAGIQPGVGFAQARARSGCRLQ